MAQDGAGWRRMACGYQSKVAMRQSKVKQGPQDSNVPFKIKTRMFLDASFNKTYIYNNIYINFYNILIIYIYYIYIYSIIYIYLHYIHYIVQ